MSDSQPFTVRPIRFDDVARMAQFHGSLSEETVRWRYYHDVPLAARTSPHRLERICRPDADYEAVLVAVTPGDDSACDQIIGVGRLEQLLQSHRAELTLVVSDAWQHYGVGHALLEQLIETARERRVRQLIAYITPDNTQMIGFCEKHGFEMSPANGSDTIKAELSL